MGLEFPCGPCLEQLSQNSKQNNKGLVPSYCKNGEVSFSGQLTKSTDLLNKGMAREDVAFK